MEAIFIDKLMNSIDLAEGKIFLYFLPPIRIAMVHEANSETKRSKSDIRRTNDHDLAPLRTPMCGEPRYMTFARQVFLRAMWEGAVLVSRQAFSVMEINHHEDVANDHACVTAKDITDVFPGRSFYITIANFGELDLDLAEQQKISEVANVPVEIVVIKTSVSRTLWQTCKIAVTA